MALIFTVRDHQRWLAPGDFTAHRPGVDIPGDGRSSFLHFGGAQSEVCCLLLLPVSRRAWGNMELSGLLAVSKGRESPPPKSGDNFNLDGRIPLGHITTVGEVTVAQVLSVSLSSL